MRFLMLWLVPMFLQAEAPARYVVRHIAGAERLPFQSEGVNAASVRFIDPQYVSVGSKGNLYVSDAYYHRILRIGTDGVVNSVAGTDNAAFAGDGGPASEASMNNPADLAVGPNDELFICDASNARIRKITADGTTVTVAGNGRTTATGDAGPAADASIGTPADIVFDNTGAFYFSASTNVRRVDASGTISRVAGTPGVAAGFAGDNGPAVQARLNGPRGLAVDNRNGAIYIADQSNHRVRRVTGGRIETFAGTGATGFAGDNGPAAAARFTFPTDVAVDSAGIVYICDRSNGLVRRVSAAGIVSTIRIPATSGVALPLPFGIALEPGKNSLIVVNDIWRNLVRIDLATSSASIVAGGAARSHRWGTTGWRSMPIC